MTGVRSHCRRRTVWRRWMRRGGKLVNDPLTLVNLTALVLFPPPVEKSPFFHFGAKHLGVCPFWIWEKSQAETLYFSICHIFLWSTGRTDLISPSVRESIHSFHQSCSCSCWDKSQWKSNGFCCTSSQTLETSACWVLDVSDKARCADNTAIPRDPVARDGVNAPHSEVV